MFDSLKQIGQLRQQAAQFQRVLAGKVVEVTSPGKDLTLKVNGKMEMLKIEIAPEALVPEKKDYLEKLILRTWAQAQKEVEKMIGAELKSQMGGLNLPF